MKSAPTLIKYDAMCCAIEAAHAVDEVKDIRDRAAAIEQYARQSLNTDAERKAYEIRRRAERKYGQLRRAEVRNNGGRPGKNPSPSGGRVLTNEQRRKELGVSKKQDEQWQALAAMSQRDFDLAIGTRTMPPTTKGMLRQATGGKAEGGRPVVTTQALWLWGRLKDFERDGLLAKSPEEEMRTMTAPMLDDVHRLAPKVAAWLKQIGKLP
jgi:hypothetical protein